MELKAPNKDLFFSKADPTDPRLGEWAQVLTDHQPRFNILGYPDDEGIKNNQGRLGAKEGPDSIRAAFYKMTPDPLNHKKFSITDLGNLNTDCELSTRHEHGRKIVSDILTKKEYFISLGGGHDYAYSDASAVASFFKEQRPLILNFDAHMDVRPSEKILNSGTAYYRLLNEFSNTISFVEVGLQKHCNSASHVEWLTEKGGKILWQDTIRESGILEPLQKLIPLSSHPAFLSIDIDVFNSMLAPGCSQSWASGMTWEQFAQAFDFLIEAFDVRGIGLYEVSPPLDVNNQTSKLAAVIMHRFIFQTLKKSL